MTQTPARWTARSHRILLSICLLAAAGASCRRGTPVEPGDGATPGTPETTGTPGTPGMPGTPDAANATPEAVDPKALPRNASALAFHPTDVDRAWFTLERGLVTTTDGGLQWRVVEGLKATASQRFFVFAVHGGDLFAGGDGLLLSSKDDGATWEPVAEHGDADVRGLATDPADDERLLALVADVGLVETRDGGATWQPVEGNIPAAAYGLWALALDVPALVTVDRASGAVHASDDGGATWSPMEATGLSGEVLSFAPGDGIAYAATDAGLHVSTDGGRNWTPRGPFSALIAVASAPDDRDTVLVVVPGGQVFRSRDRGATWLDPNAPTRTPTVDGTPTTNAAGTAAGTPTTDATAGTP